MCKVSIICPSYNHEPFITDFINSVLSQPYNNLELVIVDDCSTDNTNLIIRSFKDERIIYERNIINSGVNYSLNRAFSLSSGDILVICASDDLFVDNAIQRIVSYFETDSSLDALYSNLWVIDENNKLRDDYQNNSMPEVNHKQKAEILHDQFMLDNLLYSPGLAFRRRVLNAILPLKFGVILFQDYLMNIDIISKCNYRIVSDKFVKYRITNSKKSLSHSRDLTKNLISLEERFILEKFISFSDIALLKDIFRKEIAEDGIEPRIEVINFFIGMMSLHSQRKARKLIGYTLISEEYSEKKEFLNKKYNFTFKSLISIASKIDIHDVEIREVKTEKDNYAHRISYFLEKFISLKNSSDRKYKILRFLFLTIKFRRRK